MAVITEGIIIVSLLSKVNVIAQNSNRGHNRGDTLELKKKMDRIKKRKNGCFISKQNAGEIIY